MIPYIGDISKADAEVLRELAEEATNILEFGCGASTQVIREYAFRSTALVSIDTEETWIEKTKKNLDMLNIRKLVTFQSYQAFMKDPWGGPYDMIFDDGVDHLRKEFALAIWPHLKVGGVLAFHDTRRGQDIRNFVEVLATHFNEVGGVMTNIEGSNISCMYKKEHEPYDNWQITEKREPWQLGYGDVPESNWTFKS